jgi:phenylalanine ammonia-lyase
MDVKQQGLVQDRYALRTVPQWIGPTLEDLQLANQQIVIELNSSTDNPLIDVVDDRFHHGGNFQAASVTSAMEKARVSLVMYGRLLVSQCNEIINPSMNKGLAPNLCFDDPSLSFTCKGIDINMSSYFSELALISNPVSSHVHVAEMGNQSVNSLALIAARYAGQSVDIVNMMCAAHLYVLCQALDLRALEKDFFHAIQSRLRAIYDDLFRDSVLAANFERTWTIVLTSWSIHNQLDIDSRCAVASNDSTYGILDNIMQTNAGNSLYDSSNSWKASALSILMEEHEKIRQNFVIRPSTPRYLAPATKEIYKWVRHTLGIPLHRGLVDHPGISGGEGSNKTIGSMISRIYVAIRSGEIYDALGRATAY